MTLQYKSFECEIKSIADDGSFSIYFAAWNNLDRQGDVMLPGSIVNVDDYVRDGWVGHSHEMKRLPVGLVSSAIQDEHGFLVNGKFHSTPEAQACRTVVLERISAGKTVFGSIGFNELKSSYGTKDNKRAHILEQVAVFECSFVNLPANPEAQATEVKSMPAVAEPETKIVSLDQLKGMLESFLSVKAATMDEDAYEKCMKACDDMEDHGRKCIKMSRSFRKSLEAHDPANKPEEDEKDDDEMDEGDDDKSAKGKKAKKEDEEETEKSLRLRALRTKSRLVRP